MKREEAVLKIRTRKLNAPKNKKRSVVWLYPTQIERQYHKDLKVLVAHLKVLIKEYLLPALPEMVDEVEGKMPNDRADDFISRLNSIMLFIEKAIQPTIDRTIKDADETGLKINRFNHQQFNKVTESVLGIDLFMGEPWLLDQLKLFSSQNAQLIRSLPEQELSRVSGVVERGLQEGKRYSDLAQEIQKSFGITERRATLIARDQTKKLNSSLTKLRQQEAGVTEYIWQTSGDERVRETHRANNGKKFAWNKPPSKTGHPGDDVNCRCVAIPVLEGLLDVV